MGFQQMMLLRFSQFLAAQKKFPCDFIHIAWTFQALGAFNEILCHFILDFPKKVI